MKDMKAFFDKFLYFPFPDYASRVLIWKKYLKEQIHAGFEGKITTNGPTLHAAGVLTTIASADVDGRVNQILAKIDVSSLGHISEGYSAGAIARTVRTMVTNRRIAMQKFRPLMSRDFIDTLAVQVVNFQDDKAAFMDFTRSITGLAERRKKVEQAVAGETGDKKGDKKGKK
jgi:SpoVK/Ycf46/Vps4 family AAA+-type ATPase